MDLELDFDPQSVCRICLSSDDRLHNIFARTMVDGYLTAVPEMIQACLGLSVGAADRLPSKLCATCKTDVTHFYIFKKKCARTDEILRAMILLSDEVAIKTQPPAKIRETTHDAADDGIDAKSSGKLAPTLQMEAVEDATVVAADSKTGIVINSKHTTQATDDTQSIGDLLNILAANDLPINASAIDDDEADDNADFVDEDESTFNISGHYSDNENANVDGRQAENRPDDDVNATTMIEFIVPKEDDDTTEGNDGNDDDEVTDINPDLNLEEDYLHYDGEYAYEIESHHNDDPSTSADDDDERTSITSLVELAECPKRCGFYGSAGDLNDHLRIKHAVFVCQGCGQTRRSESGLQRHSRTCGGATTQRRKRKITLGDDEEDVEWKPPGTVGKRRFMDKDENAQEDETQTENDEDIEDDSTESYSITSQQPIDEQQQSKRQPQKPSKSNSKTTSSRPKAKHNVASSIKATVLQCDQCNKIFANQKRYEQHTRMHDMMHIINDYMQFYPCHKCRIVFPYADDLKLHQQQQKTHGCIAASLAATTNDADNPKPATANNRQSADNATDDDDDGYTDYQFLDGDNGDGYENGEYKCGVCSTTFATSQETKYHLVNHLERFECPLPECGCQYDLFVRFALHIQQKHIHGETNRCQHCGAKHRTFDELQAHIKSECAERKFPCSHCDKLFFSLKAQRNHLAWTRDGKRYPCPDCGKAFAQPGELTIHKRIHSDERPFVCTICGKAYKTSSMRTAHMDTHIPGKTFSCTICHKMLQTRTCYRNHMSRHTKEKKHECSYCQKRFFTSYHVRQHISKVHEKVQPLAVRPEDEEQEELELEA